jgi:hypothetical protein
MREIRKILKGGQWWPKLRLRHVGRELRLRLLLHIGGEIVLGGRITPASKRLGLVHEKSNWRPKLNI